MMDASVLRRFENLIRARSGLNMRPQEAHLLGKTLAARMQAFRFTSPEPYLDLLISDRAEDEWTHLFVLLTNQESYFFRDYGQLKAIRDHILPELVRRHHHSRTLRIWSAGCSTGEEPYSLAMMLDEVLPFRQGWQVLILGTDLSQSALERARAGVYGAWSFRAFDKAKQERFFTARGNKWEVKPHLRSSVTFASGNLLLDEFPNGSSELHDIDLILCRNVFIYFGRDAVARVLRKFRATLRPEAYLVTGHAELHDVALGDLQARTFPQTVIYQRGGAVPRESKAAAIPAKPEPAKPESAKPTLMAPNVAPAATRPPAQSNFIAPKEVSIAPAAETADVTLEATKLLRSKRHKEALEILLALLEREPRNLAALCLAAQAQANAGRLDEAESLCRRAIEMSSFVPMPYHLLARIAEERGDSADAKVLLKKVIYLNPASVRSYLELSAIYAREGDALRASQMQRTALEVLNDLNENEALPADEYAIEQHLTVGELKRQLQTNIG